MLCFVDSYINKQWKSKFIKTPTWLFFVCKNVDVRNGTNILYKAVINMDMLWACFWWVTFGWNFISFFGCLSCFTFISKFADYTARVHRVGTHGRGTCPTTIKLETSPVNPPEMTARNIQTILCYMLEKENISDSISKDLFDRNLRISYWSNWLRKIYVLETGNLRL